MASRRLSTRCAQIIFLHINTINYVKWLQTLLSTDIDTDHTSTMVVGYGNIAVQISGSMHYIQLANLFYLLQYNNNSQTFISTLTLSTIRVLHVRECTSVARREVVAPNFAKSVSLRWADQPP